MLFPVADKILLTEADPADTFVSIKFVVVMLTVVIVPPITRFPERLRFPPVYVVAATRVEFTVLKIPDVANIVPEVILDALMAPILALLILILVTVTFVTPNELVEILVVARRVAVVIPEDNLKF